MYIAKTEGENGVRSARNHILHLDIEKRDWSQVINFRSIKRKEKRILN